MTLREKAIAAAARAVAARRWLHPLGDVAAEEQVAVRGALALIKFDEPKPAPPKFGRRC
jgi:hypothetical protein